MQDYARYLLLILDTYRKIVAEEPAMAEVVAVWMTDSNIPYLLRELTEKKAGLSDELFVDAFFRLGLFSEDVAPQMMQRPDAMMAYTRTRERFLAGPPL